MVLCKDCNKRALYNFDYTERPLYCKKHSSTNMINKVKRLCEKCYRQATYNYPVFKKPFLCKIHSAPGMINVYSTLCMRCNEKHPSFGEDINDILRYCKGCLTGLEKKTFINLRHL